MFYERPEYKIRIKIDNIWYELTDLVLAKRGQIDFLFMNNQRKYASDKLTFTIRETAVDIIDKIKKYNGVIDVEVYQGENLFYYGFIRVKKQLQLDKFYKDLPLTAYDFIQILDVPNTTYWKFINTSLSEIATAICNSVGAKSIWPQEMNTKIKDYFFVSEIDTERPDSILKILNNFLYEYGYVLQAKYISDTPLVSANSIKDTQTTPLIKIKESDIHTGRINYKLNEKQEVSLLETNFRIIKGLKNIVLFTDLTGTNTIIKATEFYPPEGNEKNIFQKYNIVHKDNFDKSPLWFNPNTNLDWGSINKNSEVIYAYNQKTNWWSHAGPAPQILINEHYPTKSKIVLSNPATNYVLGKKYRVVGDTSVLELPPGCDGRITEAEKQSVLRRLLPARHALVPSDLLDLIKDLFRNPTNVPSVRPAFLGPYLPGGGRRYLSYSESYLRNYVDQYVAGQNNYLGKWSPEKFQYTTEFYLTKAEATAASVVESDYQRICDGRAQMVQKPVFEEGDTLIPQYASTIRDFVIRGDAYVSLSQGKTTVGVYSDNIGDTGDTSEFSTTREYTINNISAGDSHDEFGNIITIMAYQFVDTPVVFDVLNGWHLSTENGTFALITDYHGDTSWTDRWGFTYDNREKAGIVEFIYRDGIFPNTWKEERRYGVRTSYSYSEENCGTGTNLSESSGARTFPITTYTAPQIYNTQQQALENSRNYETYTAGCLYGDSVIGDSTDSRGNSIRFQRRGPNGYLFNFIRRIPNASPVYTSRIVKVPVPLLDKRGTKARFIAPGKKIDKKVMETSFIYNVKDASDFAQAEINEINTGKTDFIYEGFAYPQGKHKKHPFIGEIVEASVPDFNFINERFLVNRYIINLDSKNNQTVKIYLRRTKKWVPNVVYPDLIEYFPGLSFSQWDPNPVIDKIYNYTETNGVHPLYLPDNRWPFQQPGVVGNTSWTITPQQFYNRQNKEVENE